MSNNIRIVFSYVANEGFTPTAQEITLRCDIVRDGKEAADALEASNNRAGRQSHSRLCKDDASAVDAKIAAFAERMAYDYRALDGSDARITVERA